MVRRWIAPAVLFITSLLVPVAASAQAFRSGPTFSLGGTTAPVEQPDIAYDSRNNQYLQVVGKAFIEAHLLDASGNVLRTFNVTTSGVYAMNPRVTFSPDVGTTGGYLVTWHASIGGQIGRVLGRIVSAGGDLMTGEFEVATSATTVALSTQWTMGAPSAYSTVSGEFLVVFGGNKYTTADILGQRVSNTGALLGGNFLLSGGGADLYDRDPSVAYNPTNNLFVVGWGVYNEGGHFGFSSTRSVQAGTGALGAIQNIGQAVGVSITSMAYNSTSNQFLFAWHNQTAQSQYHYGVLLDANGTAASGVRVVSGYYSAYDALDVEWNALAGEYFLITHGINWEDAGVTIKADGNAYDNGFLVTQTTGVNGNFHPRLATSALAKTWLIVTSTQFLRTSAQFVASGSTGGGTPPPPSPPTPPPSVPVPPAPCSLSFSTSSETFGPFGGSGGFTLTTTDSCAWAAASNASWVTLSGGSLSGTGSRTLSYSVASNTSKDSRTAIVYSGNRSVTITQRGRGKQKDFNNDGLNDLVWQNRATGELAVWRMNGINILSGGALTPGNVGDTAWKIVGAFDANLDGQTDLLFQHDSGYVAIWRMSGETRIEGRVLDASVVVDPQWRIVATGDMDRDGFGDIIWQHPDGRVAVWYMYGDGFQLREGVVIAAVSDPRWHVEGVDDLNGDGKLDILWRHSGVGDMTVWFMDDRQYVGGQNLNVAMGNMQWQIAVLGDYSGDGKPDIVWRNTVTGELAAWFMDGVNYVNSWSLNPGKVGDMNWRLVGPR
jgi:hypothetical protein